MVLTSPLVLPHALRNQILARGDSKAVAALSLCEAQPELQATQRGLSEHLRAAASTMYAMDSNTSTSSMEPVLQHLEVLLREGGVSRAVTQLLAQAPDPKTSQSLAPELVNAFETGMIDLYDPAERLTERDNPWFIAGHAQWHILESASNCTTAPILMGQGALEEEYLRWVSVRVGPYR